MGFALRGAAIARGSELARLRSPNAARIRNAAVRNSLLRHGKAYFDPRRAAPTVRHRGRLARPTGNRAAAAGLSSAIWKPVIEPLARDHFVLAFDLRG